MVAVMRICKGCGKGFQASGNRRNCDGCIHPSYRERGQQQIKKDVCKCGNEFRVRRNGSKQRYCSERCRKKYYWRSPTSEEQKRKISEAKRGKPTKLRGHKQTLEHLQKRLGANGSIVPSKEELSLAPTLAKYGFRHTGDGTVWKQWQDGTVHNPDYLNDKTRTILEYFGAYWHQDDVGKEDYIIDQWKQLGYTCVIIWGSDRQAFLDDPTVFI